MGMQAYSPNNAKKYETLSYLPQLSQDEIRKQVEYMIRSSWTPCLEFSDDGDIYLNTRMGPGYYDNRYWTMYKLPMFGCTDPTEVLREIENCKRNSQTPKYGYLVSILLDRCKLPDLSFGSNKIK